MLGDRAALGRPDVVLVWPERIRRDGRRGNCRGTDPARGLALVCKFGIAQTVHSITGGYGSRAGSGVSVSRQPRARRRRNSVGRMSAIARLIECASAADEAEPVGLIQQISDGGGDPFSAAALRPLSQFVQLGGNFAKRQIGIGDRDRRHQLH